MARYTIYYSLGYSLADYQQSRARTLRPGQDRPVRYIHILAADTVDEDISMALERKENLIETVLRNRGLTRNR